MLGFVEKMTKHALGAMQHFDSGGQALNQSTTQAPTTDYTDHTTAGGAAGKVADPTSWAGGQGVAGTYTAGAVNGAGGVMQGIGNAFTAQNGYQAQLAPTTQVDYATPLSTGFNNLNQGYGQNQALLGQQQALANQFQAQIQGGGPNPAQAALAKNTGENVASQAALMAGQRGAGSNAGLVARQAAQQGASTQQNAVGQAAVLEAQQRQQASQNLMEQQKAQQSTIQGEQGIQGNLYGASANANNAQNNTNVANYGMAQGINAQTAQNNANAVNKTTSGLMNGAGSLAALFAHGGRVGSLPDHLYKMASIYHPQHLDSGGLVDFGVGSPQAATPSTPKLPGGEGLDTSGAFDSVKKMGGSKGKDGGGGSSSSMPTDSDWASYTGADKRAEGGRVGSQMKAGGKVPGKPKVNHDDYGNDTVSAKLSPGEVVIDLDTLHDEGKLGQMARFVAQNIERKKAGRKA